MSRLRGGTGMPSRCNPRPVSALPSRAGRTAPGERAGLPSAVGAAVDRVPAPAGSAPDAPAGGRTAMEVLALLDPSAGGPQGPQVYERGNTDARVILRAREAVWIQVSSPEATTPSHARSSRARRFWCRIVPTSSFGLATPVVSRSSSMAPPRRWRRAGPCGGTCRSIRSACSTLRMRPEPRPCMRGAGGGRALWSRP